MSGVGGSDGCEGAMRLQCEPFCRRAVMSDVIPGQKTDDSALDVIEDTP